LARAVTASVDTPAPPRAVVDIVTSSRRIKAGTAA
jgi:hypothetical protein